MDAVLLFRQLQNPYGGPFSRGLPSALASIYEKLRCYDPITSEELEEAIGFLETQLARTKKRQASLKQNNPEVRGIEEKLVNNEKWRNWNDQYLYCSLITALTQLKNWMTETILV